MTRLSPSDPRLESRALALLDEALDQPTERRAAWAEQQTADDPELRRRLLSLIGAADREGSLQTGGAAAHADEPPPPERIGAYRIIERLGQGGMGAVYRAEREAGDFKHVVAIKVIRPGVLSDALVERFQRERQTLADLPHPNIARLYDGGETADGQPYIVMEYVAGSPIIAWARERNLGSRRRLELFLQACEGVRFAHQNLIVHRDLTPSNVLVTQDGTVKLIDFGIARPQELGAIEGPRDATAGLSLTPGFAAPERLAGAGATTLVDIYSLGRLLQDLLESLPDDQDLRAIAGKAAAQRPEERYPSVDALIDDIRRYLSGRTVRARAGGRRYAFGKFVRRHRRSVAASAAGLLLLVGALAVTLAAYETAQRARAAEARRFEELRSLASYMLFDLNDRLERTPGNTAARVALASEAQRYLSVLAASEQASADLRLDTARGFIRLAQIQGVPPDPNLGQRDNAKASLSQAERALSALEAEGADAGLTAPEQARIGAMRAMLAAHAESDDKGAARLLARAQARLEAVAPGRRGERWHQARRTLRHAQADVAGIAQDVKRINWAADRLEREIAEWPAPMRSSLMAAEDRAVAEYWRGAAMSLGDVGDQGVQRLLNAGRMLAAVEARRPNDPHLLYWRVYNDYELFAAAARASQDKVSNDALERARANLARLLAVEESDDALKAFAVNMDEAYGQGLVNQKRYAEGLAMQKSVVQRVAARRTGKDAATRLSDVAWAEMILGLSARKSGERALTCDSWTKAEAKWAGLERQGRLEGFRAAFLPGLRANLALCRSGRPLSEFKPLR